MLSILTITVVLLILIALHYKNLSEKDLFTKCYNKDWFCCRKNSKLLKLMKACNKNKRKSFALIMIDMDNFKKYNDTRGHLAGDELILDTISTIKNNIRKKDFLVRLGGDEYLIVLFNIQTENELKQKISIIKREVLFNTSRTVSAGGIIYSAESTLNIGGILETIDRLMYEDKNNRI